MSMDRPKLIPIPQTKGLAWAALGLIVSALISGCGSKSPEVETLSLVSSTLIHNALILDGNGGEAKLGAVRIEDDAIVSI